MTTSKKQARQAGKDLRRPSTPKRDRGPIASALAQAKKKEAALIEMPAPSVPYSSGEI